MRNNFTIISYSTKTKFIKQLSYITTVNSVLFWRESAKELSKLELKSNSSDILPVRLIASLPVFTSFLSALKVRLKDLKFEFCQFKLE